MPLAPSPLASKRHQAGGVAGQRREDVFDLVEQQGHIAAGLEEDLADLQRAVAVAAGEELPSRSAYSTSYRSSPACGHSHLGQLGLAGAGRAVEQHVDARPAWRRHGACLAAARGRQSTARNPSGPGCCASPGRVNTAIRSCGPWYSRISTGRDLVADLHQVGKVGDVVLGDQVLDHADALQARAGAQGLGHLALVHAGDRRDGGKGLMGGVDLELDQRAAQLALVAGQGAVKQDGALGRVELQSGRAGRCSSRSAWTPFELAVQVLAGGGQQGHHVLGRVLGVFVQIEEQRALGKGPFQRPKRSRKASSDSTSWPRQSSLLAQRCNR